MLKALLARREPAPDVGPSFARLAELRARMDAASQTQADALARVAALTDPPRQRLNAADAALAEAVAAGGAPGASKPSRATLAGLQRHVADALDGLTRAEDEAAVVMAAAKPVDAELATLGAEFAEAHNALLAEVALALLKVAADARRQMTLADAAARGLYTGFDSHQARRINLALAEDLPRIKGLNDAASAVRAKWRALDLHSPVSVASALAALGADGDAAKAPSFRRVAGLLGVAP